jgi:hypothetical protein
MTVDVPMYLNRWRAVAADGRKLLRPLEGLRDVSTRWVVTHDLSEWKDEIAWMSLYFSAAVWASLALCVCYSLQDHLPRYRTESAITTSSSGAIGAGPAASGPNLNPEIAVLQIGLRDQLLRRAAPDRATALDDVVAVGDAGEIFYVLVDHQHRLTSLL